MANPTGKGGFTKGKSGNPNGRPPKEREEKYYSVTLNTVTFADWTRIIQKADDAVAQIHTQQSQVGVGLTGRPDNGNHTIQILMS